MSGIIDQSTDARSKAIGQNFRVRAWVCFNGTTGGSNRTINGSGNVSSVSYVEGGKYIVNYADTLPDNNYTVVGMASDNLGLISTYSSTPGLAGCTIYSSNSSSGATANWGRVGVAMIG
tara:strand:- start:220 stop:576 length:357 start_codon:yes stop_codon:yes gene_type:complete